MPGRVGRSRTRHGALAAGYKRTRLPSSLVHIVHRLCGAVPRENSPVTLLPPYRATDQSRPEAPVRPVYIRESPASFIDLPPFRSPQQSAASYSHSTNY